MGSKIVGFQAIAVPTEKTMCFVQRWEMPAPRLLDSEQHLFNRTDAPQFAELPASGCPMR